MHVWKCRKSGERELIMGNYRKGKTTGEKKLGENDGRRGKLGNEQWWAEKRLTRRGTRKTDIYLHSASTTV